MTAVDEYLARVRRAMRGMDPRVKEDILRELRAHVAESTAANGGNVGIAIAGMGDPVTVGREYRALYGYGATFKALFLGIAAGLAVPSVPVLWWADALLTPYALSLPFLAALAAWLIVAGVRAGARVGLVAGLTACGVRLAALAAAAYAVPGASTVPEGLAAFVGASLVLVVLGWLPGTARQRWRGPPTSL